MRKGCWTTALTIGRPRGRRLKESWSTLRRGRWTTRTFSGCAGSSRCAMTHRKPVMTGDVGMAGVVIGLTHDVGARSLPGARRSALGSITVGVSPRDADPPPDTQFGYLACKMSRHEQKAKSLSPSTISKVQYQYAIALERGLNSTLVIASQIASPRAYGGRWRESVALAVFGSGAGSGRSPAAVMNASHTKTS